MVDTKGFVFLIGAGPGDPRLLTCRGAECLGRSEVVVYDRLVSHRLLALAPPQAERIYVGKGASHHTMPQAEINRLLVEKARMGLTVARLKGGDPFVFGRGGEEAEALAEAGIPFEVVPGVTSAVAVPAYAGIPVTHRQFNSTLSIITGHEDPFKPGSGIAWDHLARLGGTLVFLMGLENLPEIVRKLLEQGMPASTPVALIERGTLPRQRVVTGELKGIVELSRKALLSPPVITVVGEVVKLREKLSWLEHRPLFGRRILVTRARHQASELSRRLESLGAEVHEFPAIEIAPCEDYGPLDRAVSKLEEFQWIIFTSINGVNAFFERLWQQGEDVRKLKGIRLAAIGPGTGQALASRGLRVDFMPGQYRAEAIAEGIKDLVQPGERVLLPRAREARPVLPRALEGMGLIVEEVVAYETRAGRENSARLLQLLRERRIDAVTFTSSSTVKNLVNLLGGRSELWMLEQAAVACIGPITAATAVALGLRVDLVAEDYTIEGLVSSLIQYFSRLPHRGGEEKV
ncbi:MAG: uroporphyrinogen-III C-methyltransferase [Syntrophomonadaceae bacterium]|nr:uroporphyrinogen-III C-methyltransferase [Syntrophomonadaceae bacterium]